MISNSDSSTRRDRLSKMKPLVITTYNNGKFSIDQMVSYATTIGKSIKWYCNTLLQYIYL